MKPPRPTKNWKRILLTRSSWPKRLCPDGIPELPAGCKLATEFEDASRCWDWKLYRAHSGPIYYLAIWPKGLMRTEPPLGGYARLSVREAFQVSAMQCLDNLIVKDWLQLTNRKYRPS